MANRPNKLTRGYSQFPSVPLPERWPVVTNLETRSAESSELMKDGRLVNCFAELDTETQEYMVEKRPAYYQGANLPGGGNGLGIYNWGTSLYTVSGTKVFKDITPFAPVVDNGSFYTFQQVLGATPRLVLKNVTQGWYTDGAVLTQITDVDYPATTVPGMAYLDGTLYVMRTDGGIQGSAIDDPATWDPLNVIIARNEPDLGKALIKHQTYVVALKEWSTQAFYNAGNATGSPLGRVDGAMFYYGCRNGNSVVEIDGEHFWVSQNRSAGAQVARLSQLQLSIVSTPVVDRILTRFGIAAVAYGMKICGHRFYIIRTGSFSLVYDLDQKLWYRWTDSTGTADFPMVASSYDTTGVTYVLPAIEAKFYRMETCFTQTTDNGTIFPVDIYTSNIDFGIDRRKQLNMMAFDTDVVTGSELLVRNSDDDYKSWTNFRTVDLSQSRPILPSCGTFYQRALHLRHQKATPFRIKGIDLQMDIGTL